MARLKNVVPTKSNLLNLKKDLAFAKEGYELLEEKKDILVAELMGLMDRTKSIQDQTEQELKKAYQTLTRAIVKMGRSSVSQVGLAVDLTSDISISYRSVMGVDIPLINVRFDDNPPYYSFTHTSFWLDETMMSFKEVLKLIAKLAADKIALLRIASQLKKTIHRVNALEKIYIPDYKDTVKDIESVLDEQERQMFFILKYVKDKLKNRRN